VADTTVEVVAQARQEQASLVIVDGFSCLRAIDPNLRAARQ
jgi:hypothetical protein